MYTYYGFSKNNVWRAPWIAADSRKYSANINCYIMYFLSLLCAMHYTRLLA